MAQLRRAVRRSRPRTLLPSKKGKERAVDAPTEFHALLAELDERGQLQRVYTQNIDGLERRAGLAVVDLAQMAAEEAQAESSGSDYERAKPSRRMRTRPEETDGCQMEAGEGVVVPLHGGLEEVMCGACGWREKWRKRHTKAFKKGETVDCTRCSARGASLLPRLAWHRHRAASDIQCATLRSDLPPHALQAPDHRFPARLPPPGRPPLRRPSLVLLVRRVPHPVSYTHLTLPTIYSV